MPQKLIFVYNADAGWFNVAADIAHKIFSPSTYPCSLCDLTHGVFSVRKSWDEFQKKPPAEFEFLHKDEFLLVYPALKNIPLPVILSLSEKSSAEVSVFLSHSEINAIQQVEELKAIILKKLETT